MPDAMHAGEPPRRLSDPVTLQIVRGALRAIQSEMEARDRAHGHVALHPREEGLLCRPVRRRRAADRRLEPAGVRRRGRPDRRALPARHHAARRHLLVQRLLRLQGAPSRTRPTRCSSRRCSPTAELAAFAQSWAHFNDIGGMRPGSLSPDCTEIYQEGIIVPPVRVAREGVMRRRAAAPVLPQLALPRDGEGRHARLHGRDPAGRAAPWRAVRALRPRQGRRRLRSG